MLQFLNSMKMALVEYYHAFFRKYEGRKTLLLLVLKVNLLSRAIAA